MFIFVVGTLALLTFLAWATWRSAIALREITLTQNLLLMPGENVVRLVMILICVVLAHVSGLPAEQFGWTASTWEQTLLIGLGIGGGVGIVLPAMTNLAVARFGVHIYSPIVLRNIMPRHRREWLLVPIALAPAVLLEELLFRSLLLGGFTGIAPPMVLAVVWSVLFGALHLAQGSLGIVVAMVLGLLLSALFLATAGLLAPLIAHYAINMIQLVWAAFDKSWQ